MTIARSFIEYLELQGFGSFGVDLFIGGAPLDADDRIIWVLSSGGNNSSKNVSGEKQKAYLLSIYCRDTDPEYVDQTLQNIEELLNTKDCIELTGYMVLESETTLFQSDQDIDSEDRTIGLLQVTFTVYSNI